MGHTDKPTNGRVIPKGCAPPGYTNRFKEIIQNEEGTL